MKDWSGKDLCFECAKKLGANINIGRKIRGRCHRCHSEQILFRVTEVPVAAVPGEEICPECAHPVGTHASTCQRSELDLLRQERREIVAMLEEFGRYEARKSLADQLRQALQQIEDERNRPSS